MAASVNRPKSVQALKSKLMHYPPTLDNVCPDGAAGLDEGEWERLIEQLQPVEKPRVVRVMRQGRQLVDASTGELVEG